MRAESYRGPLICCALPSRRPGPAEREVVIHSVAQSIHWIVFLAGVVLLLVVDLGVFNRRPHAVRFREAMAWTIFWIALSLVFNVWVYWRFGPQAGLEFFTGYLLEKSLSIDNIFVFLVIFRYFGVPSHLQHRVLFWGVAGAIVLRAVFIVAGAALLARFEWLFYVFGAFLLVTGWRIMAHETPEVHPERNPMVRIFRRFFPVSSEYHGEHFFVREAGRLIATPLALVLVVIEATDVVFAVDSIPAIFGVTTDPFLIFTSNILAILGLRALYFVLHDLMGRFRYLSVGLGLVLMFIGAKMVVAHWIHIPVVWSLAVVSLILGTAVVVSWIRS
ncbi:MAG: TerC family protein, partial [Acidimicrobiia bacterium]|nr:TerC family protein [Acidimicrobiia bacterium]